MKVVVSCTTIYDRQRQASRMLSSLLTQTRVPDEIRVYVSQKPFLLDKGIPPYCLDPLLYAITEKDKRIHVEWVENKGPYRKLLPALKRYWQQDICLITCDDDIEYKADFIETAISLFQEQNCCIAFQGTRINSSLQYESFEEAKGTRNLWNLPKGVAGIVYSPLWFSNQAIFDVDLRWKNDDLWFAAWRIAAGLDCYLAKETSVRNSMGTKTTLWSAYNEKGNTTFFEEILVLGLYEGWFPISLVGFFSEDIQILVKWVTFMKQRLLPLLQNEALEGNLWSRHHQKVPEIQLLGKQKNILWIARQIEGESLEVGFNAGFSALLLLLANPKLHLHAFDLGEHAYVKDCFEVLKEEFGDRIQLTLGDSCETLKALKESSYSFLHIDGGHSEEVATSDIKEAARIGKPYAFLLVDDMNLGSVKKAVEKRSDLQEINLPFSPSTYTHALYRLVKVP